MIVEDRKSIKFLGIDVDVIDTSGLCKRVVDFASSGSVRKVMYVNTDCMLISMRHKEYRRALNNSDLVYADGMGVVWGARLWGKYLPGRSTGADFMPDFCKIFAGRGLRLFFLGGKQGVAEEASARLLKTIPNLQIVGTHHGYFKREENRQIIELIRKTEPHILIVGFGAPKQETWIDENAEGLQVPVVWGVGGLFDFLSGRTRRGPQWLLDHGFEWLCRLIVEPGRLWRRYLIGNAKFVFYIFWYRFIVQRTW